MEESIICSIKEESDSELEDELNIELSIDSEIPESPEIYKNSSENPEIYKNSSENPEIYDDSSNLSPKKSFSYNEYYDVMLKKTFGYVETLEKANETVKLFQERTESRFVCYKVQSGFGSDDWCAKKHKILWHQNEQKIKTENYTPMYDGIPYILLGGKLLECQYGYDRNVYQKRKHFANRKVEELKIKDRRLPVSKKVNCPARIVLKDIIKFPQYKVEKNTVGSRRLKSMLLRWALDKGQAKGERRIYIQLPDENDHSNHTEVMNTRRAKRARKTIKIEPTVITLDASLNEPAFFQNFRVTKELYQFLVNEWQSVEAEDNIEEYQRDVLFGLHYLASTHINTSGERFQIRTEENGRNEETEYCTTDYVKSVERFCDFLISQETKYLRFPSPEERITIAEVIKQESGFPGSFGAMDAALIQIQNNPDVEEDAKQRTSTQEHDYLPYHDTNGSYGCAIVLQFIADHQLLFRDIHLGNPSTGTRIKIFQESEVWKTLQSLTSAETHIVAAPVYPLAPAIMTPHTSQNLNYQESLYNANHYEAHKLAAGTMRLYKSRFRRLQLLSSVDVDMNRKLVHAACILHNIALLHEADNALDDLPMNYQSENDKRGWHEMDEEVVAEFSILGGEEKRHYLTTVMTPHPLLNDRFSPHHNNNNNT